MRSLLGMLVIFVGAQLILAGIAIAEGFLIHWAIPAIDLSVAIFIGMTAAIAVAYAIISFLNSAVYKKLNSQIPPDNEGEEEDEVEIERILMHLPPLSAISQPSRRRQRKKK